MGEEIWNLRTLEMTWLKPTNLLGCDFGTGNGLHNTTTNNHHNNSDNIIIIVVEATTIVVLS